MCPLYGHLNEILNEKANINQPPVSKGSSEDAETYEEEFNIMVDTANKAYVVSTDEEVELNVSEVEIGGISISLEDSSASSDKRKYPTSLKLTRIADSKRITKQPRLIDAFEAKSKTKEKELEY